MNVSHKRGKNKQKTNTEGQSLGPTIINLSQEHSVIHPSIKQTEKSSSLLFKNVSQKEKLQILRRTLCHFALSGNLLTSCVSITNVGKRCRYSTNVETRHNFSVAVFPFKNLKNAIKILFTQVIKNTLRHHLPATSCKPSLTVPSAATFCCSSQLVWCKKRFYCSFVKCTNFGMTKSPKTFLAKNKTWVF